MNCRKILGIKISNITREEFYDLICRCFKTDGAKQIATVNPEFCVSARSDIEFKNILNKADLALPDGMGIILASYFLLCPLKSRLTGVEAMFEICRIAEQKNKEIYLLGAKNIIAYEAAKNLKIKFPKIKIAGAENEFTLFGKMKDEKIISRINRSKADILFVAFGAPKQEKWIYHNLPKFNHLKIAVGVGGAFDYISGHVKRAPLFMRKIGLEWLYRLCKQPWRIKRIINAVIIFPILVLLFRRK